MLEALTLDNSGELEWVFFMNATCVCDIRNLTEKDILLHQRPLYFF